MIATTRQGFNARNQFMKQKCFQGNHGDVRHNLFVNIHSVWLK